jgi:deoxyadenosine/deoxycytidine kinase
MKYIFSIDGNIGSGKSTLIENLKTIKIINGLEVFFLPEPVSVWNTVTDSSGVSILEKYYFDQKRYAFSFQMMAYITRLKQIRDCLAATPVDCIIITERCMYTDREIFAKMLFDCGKIEEIEYTIYLKWFDFFISDFTISGIIYVKTLPSTCLGRVNSRNRKGEETIPLSYLTDCHRYHEQWLNAHDSVLVLNGELSELKIDEISNFIFNKINNGCYKELTY